MPKFRHVAPLLILFGCMLLVGGVAPTHAQTSLASAFKYPPAAGLATGRGPSPAASIPVANYDEQLGITFSQSFASLAYNVTAVWQSDSNGYGPAYLLNGLTSSGYWYQVGVAYDWPETTGGYQPGIQFIYEVWNSNANSVFPTEGGGLESFSGNVSSGDSVVMQLYFSSGNVVMSAKDLKSGATASVSYSSEGAMDFVGSPLSVSNSKGFFTGLMTEWYHANPYYGSEGQVTYSTTQALSSAWMWIDEYDPSNLSWSGAFGVAALGPSSYTSAPNSLQSFSTNGASEASDAYEFVTGYTAATTTTTSITLLPAAQSTTLSSANGFTISYTSKGTLSTLRSQGGTSTLTTDTGTEVTISGTSTASTSSEEWVLDSQAAPVSVTSGSIVTFDYYDLLAQTVSYSVSGGGSPTSPTVSYSTAPGNASSQSSPTVVVSRLSQSLQTIWVARGSPVSVANPIPGGSGERWITQTAQWFISTPNQVLQLIPYVHQYNITVEYGVSGGGSGYGAPTVSCSQFGHQTSAQLGSSTWVDAGPSCSYSSALPSSTQKDRWAIPSPNLTVSATGTLAPTYYYQFNVTLGYSVIGGGSGSGAPGATCAEYGAQASVAIGTSVWVDAGPSCTYATTLPGSTQNERWAVPSSGLVISGPGAATLAYYHQYPLGVSYTIQGGGSPTPPTITGDFFGAASTVTLSSSSVTEWFDAGSQYTLANPLPSSTSSERWTTATGTSGTLSGPGTISATFYHQYLISALLAVVGGGTPIAPTLSYSSLGSLTSAALSASKQSFWADVGSQYSAPAQLGGSSSSERWSSSADSGSVQGVETLTFTYYHQFLLTISGPASESQWYNASATVTLSVHGVSNRTAGAGVRITSYSLDGGSPTVLQPTAGMVTITVVMGAAHRLSISSVEQYLVSLDASTTGALISITPPTIGGDGYWYDQGTPVSLVLNGVWNRTSGTGERLASYTVNGVLNTVSTANNVDALALSPISSPESVSAVIIVQYHLSTGSGSVESTTAPAISGDGGWYDAGTAVTVAYNYSWNSTSGESRANAIAFAVDQGAPTSLERAASGTFSVQVTMTAPHAITIKSVTQYHFTLSGGYDVYLSQTSPTSDSFYDSGSALTVSADYTWNVVDGNTRENLFSYTLGDQVTNVTRADSGTFTTPTITFAGPQELTFTPVTQYLISFQFKDSTGTHTITPASFQIQVDDPQVINVTQSQIWLDTGTRYQIYSVMWEGSDVNPTSQTVYTAGAPVNQTVTDSVYAARVVATDYLGLPLSGAQVSITLANGTTVQRSTSSNGTVTLGLIPFGTFHGSLSYLGTTTSISGDASTQAQTPVKAFASYPTFGLIGAVVAVAVVGALLAVRRRRASKSRPSVEQPPVEQGVLCRYCGSKLMPGGAYCPECGRSQL